MQEFQSRVVSQETHLSRARASIKQTLSWYTYLRKSGHLSSKPDLASLIKPQIEILNATLHKLDSNLIKIAAFGLVSRGKSAVLNSLLGEKILETGPLNGVTQWPRSLRWQPGTKVCVELIDTPGLDEINGEVRGEMARTVAQQADLILFIVSGDITNTEYQALLELRQAQKPLILVFNKIDLYPDTDKNTIYHNLQVLGAARSGQQSDPLLPDEIVMVAAEPAPMEVRVEYADGRISYEWETPKPQVQELKQTILNILNREGRSLLALNALVQARESEAIMAEKTLHFRQQEAEELIWRFCKYKALAIALNPIAVLDVIGGLITDLALIRSLARLYSLPMTSYEATGLLKTILLGSGSLLLSEIASNLVLGMGKTAAAVAGEGSINITTFAGGALAQSGVASYSAYAVGKAAQVYLENGCSWGRLGANTVIEEILTQVEKNTILYRLKQKTKNKINC
ncbi:GTP-binding protein [Cylindrospermopsis raciborskii]|uniref:GTP-binding protein n=1 Tax=Cylindrospermopsis raciborskii TaxID=77022 RepID=UPI000778CF8D|nr:GTP-binding protein [Cylindrospermopsis raciborskii]MCZ2201592.1 GTP-binding protein [Cylindrospermopsis raciborskii PAMP2012]MCZ2206995.1 GTP-binding protein [Cylindrospermopsis raciborskii PAMP2011]